MEKSEDRAKLLKGGACEYPSPGWTGRKRIQPGWSCQLRLQLTVSLAQNSLRELVRGIGGALVQTALYMSLRVWTEISFSFSTCHLKPVEGLRGQACPSFLLRSDLSPPRMQPRGLSPFLPGLEAYWNRMGPRQGQQISLHFTDKSAQTRREKRLVIITWW